LLSISG